MSAKANAVLAVAIDRGGFGSVGAPVMEGLLNDIAVSEVNVVETDASGKAVMFVVTSNASGADVTRPVVNSSGDVRIFADAASAMSIARKSNLPDGGDVVVTKFAKVQTLGDPVASLKTAHKVAVTELALANKGLGVLVPKIAAAQSLHWDTAPDGSAEKAEYADYMAKQVAMNEWKTILGSKVANLAQGLTSAGIDPATYLPLPVKP